MVDQYIPSAHIMINDFNLMSSAKALYEQSTFDSASAVVRIARKQDHTRIHVKINVPIFSEETS